MKIVLPLLAACALCSSPAPPHAAPSEDVVELDFESGKLPEDWSVSSGEWKVRRGVLDGRGPGYLQLDVPRSGDFRLSFRAWTEEKANVEVKLIDPDTGREMWTFAFLGTYHSILDGPKSCILRNNHFVNVDARTWIFPGRWFDFRVRARSDQYEMFLNDALAPRFVDEDAPEEAPRWLLRIQHGPELEDTRFELDDVKLEMLDRED
jgi:hypothetical protein